jgi:hypothetical protein
MLLLELDPQKERSKRLNVNSLKTSEEGEANIIVDK